MKKCNASFVYSNQFLNYHFHTDHPFNQVRVKMTKDLLEAENKLTNSHILEPRIATEEEIRLIHSSKYIQAVKKAGEGLLPEEEAISYGLGTEDTPIFPNMHQAAAMLVGGTLTAVDAVMNGQSNHALNLGGGLHHGFRNQASGFCIYNDGAIAIKYLREKYNVRVLYVDTDAHHGDGVQAAFYDDPQVCTFSIHETGRYLYPGTGNINERGINAGYGYSFNFPLDAFTEDESFLDVYETALIEVVDYFQPDVIITQNGVDAHYLDPLTHLSSTMKTYEKIPQLAHELAHKYCDGKWIALGGGGYDIWRVVPRAWAQIWNVMCHQSVFSGDLPIEWIKRYEKESPVKLPTKWDDPEGLYKPIPRKKEISEKNNQILNKALQYTRNNMKFQ
ncbi:acetoin utilization protein AcuC [Aquibacillus koreensis]|uniref:Acetoin utilization protein AcuC n=1 Tax=Aquibacillus koreensis TaxID=279446 RepID=A0A9X3WHY9_9BACI|nr:acetoin utilization protein AcuC [Aquibacillus koreensis]MCT2535006.1 acetoin utilization protein AcuC [Aquibacillus koreensis]MDC3419293.1 acetoin utilization protein AcuC [Aquibacillus koreensis]